MRGKIAIANAWLTYGIFEQSLATPRWERLSRDLATVTRELEDDGVAKFAASYASVLAGIEAKVGALAAR